MILEFEKQFALCCGGLQEVVINIDEEGDDKAELGSDIASLAQSVISMDSIVQNADFVELVY